jgi:hypothetical protein
MRCREIRNERWRHSDEDDEQPPILKVWRPKLKSQVDRSEAAVNMVIMLPQEFRATLEDDIDFKEESAAQLLLYPNKVHSTK